MKTVVVLGTLLVLFVVGASADSALDQQNTQTLYPNAVDPSKPDPYAMSFDPSAQAGSMAPSMPSASPGMSSPSPSMGSSMGSMGAPTGAPGGLTPPGGSCFPACRYDCPPAPECPAECKPICKKPTCKMECEGLGPASCTVQCEKPRCQIECSEAYHCAGECPVCQTVCEEPKCNVQCTPPPPKCQPICPDPYCEWECYKPAECPAPKCQLQCDNVGSCHGCCSCSNPASATAAIELASATHLSENSMPHVSLLPSFIEVAHQARLDIKQKGKEQCCPCVH